MFTSRQVNRTATSKCYKLSALFLILMKQKLFFAIVTLIAILGLVVFSPPASSGGTNVGGLISSDTVWTKTGSPYSFTGSVGISQGVTLTVESGVTINLGSYSLRVDGTLTAKGNSNDKINFNGGQITLSTLSNGWSEQSQSGCIIQNAILSQTTISSISPIKIDNCNINGEISVTSSIVSNNQITGDITCQSSTITGNNIQGNIIIGTLTLGGTSRSSDSSIVSRNTVEGRIFSGSTENAPLISDNTVSGGGISCTGYCSIKNNYVHDCESGISVFTLRVFGGWFPCYATVENNLVTGNTNGIDINLLGATGKPTIQKNTISGNKIGISQSYGKPTIKNNNIQRNTEYNYYLKTSDNVDASSNWWGTTDETAISQFIYDSNDNIDMGTVTFKPTLTAPNPDAPTTPKTNTTPSSTQPPSPSPSIPEFPATITLTIILATTAATIIIKKQPKPKK